MAFYAQTTTQNSQQAHLATVYYNRMGLDTLVPKFRFYQVAEKFDLPAGSGRTMQMWRDNVPGYNTTPASEGVPVEAAFVNGSATLTVTVEPYSDFMATSSLMDITSITDEGERMVRALSIRAAGSVDTIVRTEIDSNSGQQVATIGSNLAAADLKKNVALLEGLNVDPFDGTRWLSIIHPYVKYDLIADTTTGGFIDALKYANGQQVLNGEVGEIAGARILTTTNVGDDGTAAPNKKYFSYLFGYQGVGVCNLAGKAPDGVVDPKRQNFKIDMYQGGGAWDPTRAVGTVSAYNFVFAAKTLDAQRFKIIKSDSSII